MDRGGLECRLPQETDDVNKVQLDIREGHQETIDKILEWAKNEKLGTVCDLGCGVGASAPELERNRVSGTDGCVFPPGSLAIPLAQQGAKVSASDISAAMVKEAGERARAAGVNANFEVSDLESVTGKYGTVSCVDVMIHYPTDKMADMVTHLAGIAQDRIYLSFAPKTLQYSVLKKIGSLFPGPSKVGNSLPLYEPSLTCEFSVSQATRAYLHSEADVTAALEKAGFEVKQRHLTARNFYFSLLLEAVPKAA